MFFGKGPNSNPNYEKNADKVVKVNGIRFIPDRSLCCVLCGKYCGHITPFAVYLNGYGESIPPRGDDCNDDLGFYPVGSDCAKKLKKLGVAVYDGTTFKKV